MKIITLYASDGVWLDTVFGGEKATDAMARQLDSAIDNGCTHYVADVSNDVEGYALLHMLNKNIPCIMITPPDEPQGKFAKLYSSLKSRVMKLNQSGRPDAVYPYDATPDAFHMPDMMVYLMQDACILSYHMDSSSTTSKFFSLLGYR